MIEYFMGFLLFISTLLFIYAIKCILNDVKNTPEFRYNLSIIQANDMIKKLEKGKSII